MKLRFDLRLETISPQLLEALLLLMKCQLFDSFKLVGGTALSLYRGHRRSIDIDLFTDAQYGSIDFFEIEAFLKKKFPVVDCNSLQPSPFGNTYFIGEHPNQLIKLDLFYTDHFCFAHNEYDVIRIANSRDILAMKLELIASGGRKKDFWDVYEFLNCFSLKEMIEFHKLKYQFGHSEEQIKSGLVNFSIADDDLDPVCLKGYYWELIKLDFVNLKVNV